jgi:phage terminase large subunit
MTFTCDDIQETDDCFQLYDFDEEAGINEGCGHYEERRPNGSMLMTTLVKENLRALETVKRVERTISEEYKNEYQMDRPEAEGYVEREPENHRIEEL